jgi:hypothetical protein
MLSKIILVHLKRNLAHLVPDGIEAHIHPDGGYTLTLWGKSEAAKNRLLANLEEIMFLADNIVPLAEIVIKGQIDESFKAVPALKLYEYSVEGVVDRMAKESNRPPAPDRLQE